MEEQEPAVADVEVDNPVVVVVGIGRKRKRPSEVERLPMYIIRDQNRLMSRLQENHGGYVGEFQHQPYDEEHAVCLLIAYGHIIGRHQGINSNSKDRLLFDKIANQLHIEQPSVKGGFSNPRGHYHFQVLKVVLDQKQDKKPVKISLGVSSSVENTLHRSEDVMAAIASSESSIFVFRGTIVLTAHGNVAEGHYAVVRKIPGQVPVLLDGLFDGPKKLCVDSLVRYTQIEALYAIVDK